MGYTKEQREQNAKKLATETINTSNNNNNVVVETNTSSTKKYKLEDTTLIRVKSNVFGRLYYRNSRTGDEYNWYSHGDTQDLYIADLREMKGTQRRFFSENWIMIDGTVENSEEFEGITVEDIYTFLQVQQYYKDVLCPDNLPSVLNLSISELEDKIPKMSKGVKLSLIVLANTKITSGELDSLNKIKALEKILGCELTRPE